MQKYDLVGIGCAYVDELGCVDRSLLKEYEIPIGGARAVEKSMLDDIRRHSTPIGITPGGSSANSVSMFAALGGKAGFMGKVGRDAYGTFFLNDMRRRCISWFGNPYPSSVGSTAICIVLQIADRPSERSFAYNNGCCDAFCREDFLTLDYSSTKYLLIEALLLRSELAKPVIQQILNLATGNCQIVVSLHGTEHWAAAKDVAGLVASTANVICGNQDEVTDFMSTAVLDLRQREGTKLLTTMGERGARAQTGSAEYSVIASTADKVVDGIGAGDAFLGGFLYGATMNLPTIDCLKMATRVATQILGTVGGRIPVSSSGVCSNHVFE